MSDWRQRLAIAFTEEQTEDLRQARSRFERETAFAQEFVRPGAELFAQELKRIQGQVLEPEVEEVASGVDVRVHGYPLIWLEARVSEFASDAGRGYLVLFCFHGEAGHERYHGDNFLGVPPAGGSPITPDEVAERLTNLYLEGLKAGYRG